MADHAVDPTSPDSSDGSSSSSSAAAEAAAAAAAAAAEPTEIPHPNLAFFGKMLLVIFRIDVLSFWC